MNNEIGNQGFYKIPCCCDELRMREIECCLNQCVLDTPSTSERTTQSSLKVRQSFSRYEFGNSLTNNIRTVLLNHVIKDLHPKLKFEFDN